MNEDESQKGSRAVTSTEGEVHLLDLAIDLAKHKNLIIGLPLVAAVIAALLSFTLPSIYKASTKLMPPQQAQSSAAAVLSQLGGGLGGLAAGVAGLKSPNDLYIGMLRSRTIANNLVERFQLGKEYGIESPELIRKKLEVSTAISSGKDGLITIEVEGKNQKLVAILANGYVEELLKLTRILAVTEASQRRMFYERQMEQTKSNLAEAEVQLKGGLDQYGVINVDSESRAVMETVARLKAQVSAKEIQLNSIEAFVTKTNSSYRRLSEELRSLRQELVALESGRANAANNGQEKSEVGNNLRPGFENIKLLRDLKYHQMLYEILAKQYEIARLDEAKEPSIIQVLDPAIEPERRYKPQRTVIVMLTGLAVLILTVAWSIVFEAKHRAMRDPESATRWRNLSNLLRVNFRRN